MRKPKPRKTLEVNPNEKKEVPVMTWDPSKARLWQATVFVTVVAQMARHLEEHREIWRNACKEGGFLRHKYKLKMTGCVKTANKIIEHYKEKGVEPNPLAALEMEKMMRAIKEEDMAKKSRIRKGVGSQSLHKEDETLPGQEKFYETILGAWGCSLILSWKMASFAKSEGILKDISTMNGDLLSYLKIVDKTIVRHVEELPSKKERAKLFKKPSAEKLEFIHNELRKKGYKI